MSCHISVAQGIIHGKECTTFEGVKYYSFEGIPYAKPPVGKLRFRAPQPPENWTGIKDCTKPGNKCAQVSSKGFEGSEDCLYLNIYTPSLPAEKLEKLPVLLFIHGGRLLVGYGNYYQPDYYIRHNVILVTLNYRLSILGFLSLETPEVPGNAGMKDIVAALRWIQGNIQMFNGDMNNVTLYGESAGAALASACLTSKMSDGLYHKLIAQSGHSLNDVFFSIQDNIGKAKNIAAEFGKQIDDVNKLYDYFQNLPIEELVTKYTMIERHPYQLSPVLMGVIEKKFDGVESFWDEHPLDVVQSNRFAKVPMIFGSNMYEGAAFVRFNENGIYYEQNLKVFIPSHLQLKHEDPRSDKIAKAIKQRYFKGKKIDDSTKVEYLEMLSDAYFNRDQTKIVEILTKYSSECYVYKFNYHGNMNLNTMKMLGVKGSTHGDGIQYQFYKENKAKKGDDRDWAIVNFLSEVWANFAKYGKPTWTNQNVEWVPYTPQEKKMIVIDDKIDVIRNTDYDSYKFWNDILSEKSKI